MNNKFFHIENKNSASNKPIRVVFKNDDVEFKVDSNGWINNDEGILLCSRCNYEIEKKEVKSVLRNKNICPKCKVRLNWNLQSQYDFQKLVDVSAKVLKRFFIDKNFHDSTYNSVELALDFVNDNDKEELLKPMFKLMCNFMIDADKRLRRLEGTEDEMETEKPKRLRKKTAYKKRARLMDADNVIRVEEAEPIYDVSDEEETDLPF